MSTQASRGSQSRASSRAADAGKGAGSERVDLSPRSTQPPTIQRLPFVMDEVDIASMDSFPCSDPPGYYPIRT